MKFTIISKQFLSKIRNKIVLRTKSGKDKNNVAFKPYSFGYAKKKRSTKVDLTLSGHMLNSFQPISDSQIGFTNIYAQNKAQWNKNNDRQFIGLTQEDITLIQKQVYKQTQKQLQQETIKWNSK